MCESECEWNGVNKKRVKYELLMFCNEKFFEKWDSKKNCGCSSNRNKWKRWANRWTTIKATISYRVANLRRYDRSTAQTMLVSNFFSLSHSSSSTLPYDNSHGGHPHYTHRHTQSFIASTEQYNIDLSTHSSARRWHLSISQRTPCTPIEDRKKKKIRKIY